MRCQCDITCRRAARCSCGPHSSAWASAAEDAATLGGLSRPRARSCSPKSCAHASAGLSRAPSAANSSPHDAGAAVAALGAAEPNSLAQSSPCNEPLSLLLRSPTTCAATAPATAEPHLLRCWLLGADVQAALEVVNPRWWLRHHLTPAIPRGFPLLLRPPLAGCCLGTTGSPSMASRTQPRAGLLA